MTHEEAMELAMEAFYGAPGGNYGGVEAAIRVYAEARQRQSEKATRQMEAAE